MKSRGRHEILWRRRNPVFYGVVSSAESVDCAGQSSRLCSSMMESQMSESMQQVDLLLAACCVVASDGETSGSELRVLERLAKNAGVGAASLAAMLECAETDDEYIASQFRIVVTDKRKTMNMLFKVAIVDGKLRKPETVALKKLAKLMSVRPEQFDEWLKRSVDRARKKSAGKSK